jgi:Zn-dependent protease with chaperone function
MAKSFSGIYFDSLIPEGKSSVTVEIGAAFINILGMSRPIQWRSSDAVISFGGSNDHLVFFALRQHADQSFYIIGDRELYQHLATLGKPDWAALIQKHQSTQTKNKFLLATFVFAIAMMLTSLIYFRGEIAGSASALIPFGVEQMLGDKLLPMVHPAYLDVKDPVLLQHLNRILDSLKPQLAETFRDFKVHISSSEDLNAFALPGGHIIFNMGALRQAESAAEILGVAAHEMAHVTERHVIRNLVQGAGLFLLLQLMLGDVSGLIAVIADQGQFLLNQSFSRSMETEADRKGMEYLVAARIDPRGMAMFFDRIVASSKVDQQVSSTIEKSLEFLSTHPDTESRIKDINLFFAGLSDEVKASLQTDVAGFKDLKAALKTSQTK